MTVTFTRSSGAVPLPSFSGMEDFICPSLSHRIGCTLLKAFRTIIPRLEDRTELTWTTSWRPILCFAPFIFMAYLARRPDTYYYRLALLPLTLSYILYAAYSFVWTDPRLNLYNWGQGLFAAVALSKTIEYGLTPAGMLKKGEIKPGVYKSDYKAPNPPSSPSPNRPILRAPAWLSDSIDLIHTMRGLQYQFAGDIHIPSPTRPQSPTSAFFLSTFYSFLTNFFLLDLIEASVKQFFPLVGQPTGGTIFDPSLPVYPVPWRYISSTTVHILTGSAILVGFCLVYDLFTLIGVGLCGQEAKDWPPIMDNPWTSDSLHSFWGRRWHQEVRQIILVFGGYPAGWIASTMVSLFGVKGKPRKKAGDMGMLLGTFFASGLFHECAMYSMGHGFDHSVSMFFSLQGPLMIGERFWKRITGRQVRGWPGRLWLWLVLFIGGQRMVDAWHVRGLGAGMVIPPMISPARQVLFPLAKVALSWAGVEGVF